MIRTNISLHQEQYELIKKESEENGCSISWILREAIDSYFKTETLTKEEKEVAEKLGVSEKKFADYKKENTPKGICKVCGAGLKPGGDWCMGKTSHKQ